MAQYEIDAGQIVRYAKKLQQHPGILDEHAEYLKALTEIDALLDKMQYVVTFEQAMELASQMDAAMPESIVATRKESDHE